jgi:hypothetical protein
LGCVLASRSAPLRLNNFHPIKKFAPPISLHKLSVSLLRICKEIKMKAPDKLISKEIPAVNTQQKTINQFASCKGESRSAAFGHGPFGCIWS